MNLYETALKNIPYILNESGFNCENLDNYFNKLNGIVNFDEISLYYINFDKINLQKNKVYQNIDEKKVNKKKYIEINDEFLKYLYKIKPNIINNESELAKKLILDKNKQKVYINLLINQTLIGFLIIERNEEFKEEEIEVLIALGSILTYKIKDAELSEVFKIQLKALEENITSKTIAYKTIKEQNQKVLEANKAKNEFLANVSHELRTPLNSIIGFSDVLKQEIFGKLNEKQKEYINDIYISGVHLLGMINEILDISKIESKAMGLNYSKFDITKSINEVVNVIKPLSDKKNIEIIFNSDNIYEIEADYQKIQQILYNLLSNAIKFTFEKGKIYIDVSKTSNNKIKVAIKDTGVGIDKKYHGKIFSKFVQLDSIYTKSESSTGLGLTITKKLVTMHGGRIYVESKINEGSTFTFEMPSKKNKVKK